MNGVRVEQYHLKDTAGESSGGQGLCHAMSLRWPPHSYLERVCHTHSYACANASVSLFSPSPVSIQGRRTKAGPRAPGCLWQRFKSQRPEPWPSRCVRAWIISEGAHHSKKHKQSMNSRGQWLFVMRNDDAAAVMTKCSSDLMSPWHWLRLLSMTK